MICKIAFWLALAAASTGCLAQAAAVDQAGNRFEALQMVPADADSPQSAGCTANGAWCIALGSEETSDGRYLLSLDVSSKTDAKRHWSTDAGFMNSGTGISYALWPHVVPLADARRGILVGILESSNGIYSGGRVSNSFLRLYQIQFNTYAKTPRLLSVPVASHVDLDACFNADVMARRAGSCDDQYTFSGSLALDADSATRSPRFIYTTHATRYPDRDADSPGDASLRKSDLVEVTDRRCSFRRVFALDARSGTYQPDRPLPDCHEFVAP